MIGCLSIERRPCGHLPPMKAEITVSEAGADCPGLYPLKRKLMSEFKKKKSFRSTVVILVYSKVTTHLTLLRCDWADAEVLGYFETCSS